MKKIYFDRIEWRDDDTKFLHRVDGPAVEWSNGAKFWYQNGKIHRLDGPAAEYKNGTKYWYQNGKCHRIDGPAIEEEGYKEWWLNGSIHTEEEWFNLLMEDEKLNYILKGEK